MRAAVTLSSALLCGAIALQAREPAVCQRRWTFPVPFYQSVAWSPDGSKIAFAAVTTSWDEGYGIFVVGSDASGASKLDTGDQPALYPVFSPDGSRIAFSSKREGDSDVYVMAVDGSGMTRLTDHQANDGYPSWSPDGTRIAFHSDRDGDYEIYVMSADGREGVAGRHRRQVTARCAPASPARGPDQRLPCVSTTSRVGRSTGRRGRRTRRTPPSSE